MPISNEKYIAPTWNNNNPPSIDAGELQDICDTLANLPESGTAAYAKQLSKTSKIITNLGSTAEANFNGTATDIVKPGVQGVLSKANGGTGNANGYADRLTNSTSMIVDLNKKDAVDFIGSGGNVNLGITGTLPVEYGGTGEKTKAGVRATLGLGNTTGALPIANGGTGNTTGNAATATKLATARTIRTNLASTSTASFDGSANITPGITGILPVANGGTGNANGNVPYATSAGSTTGNAATATKLASTTTFRTNLSSTDTITFDGSGGAARPGVQGTLSIANGGTGNSTGNAATATKLATARTIRTNLASTSTASFDGSANITPGVQGKLPISNGGTGASTAADARANLGVNAIQFKVVNYSYAYTIAANGYKDVTASNFSGTHPGSDWTPIAISGFNAHGGWGIEVNAVTAGSSTSKPTAYLSNRSSSSVSATLNVWVYYVKLS